MATNDIRTRLEGLTGFTVTTLQGLPPQQMWRSGVIRDPTPHHDQVGISFRIIGGAAVVADDRLNFFWCNLDGGTPELVDAVLPDTEGRTADVLVMAEVRDICDLVFSVRFNRVNQVMEGSFVVFNPGDAWQLVIENEGGIGDLAIVGQIVRYRFGTPQIQP